MELIKYVRNQAKNALFYPACGEDWEPLCQLSHYCDVFVYCDRLSPSRKIVAGKTVGSIERDSAWLKAQLCKIHTQTSAGKRLQFHGIKELEYTPPENSGITPSQRWAKLATVSLKLKNGTTRRLKLVYIKGSAESMYQILFFKQSIAPRIICIRHPEGVDLKCRNGRLGQMVINGDSKPKYIATHYPVTDCFDWGWNQVVRQKFPKWDHVSLLARHA